jgi:spermidine synthase
MSTPGATGSVSVAEPAPTAGAAGHAGALALMGLSGFAALAYQIVWTQQATVWLGHEAGAVLAVIGAFFGGLAVGSFVLGRRVDASDRPARWYAVCEAVIGAWSLVLVLLMAPVGAALLALIGAQPTPAWQWAVTFVGSFLLLLPATAAMGATLPAMERVLAARRRPGASIAALYAANTLGAVLGVLAAAFWLVPAHGLTRTAWLCAALNFVCAAATPWLFGARAGAAPATPRPTSTHGLPTLAATGLLGIGYEVLVVRVLRQFAENTVYTFALLLAVYLVGTALGAAAYQRGWGASGAPQQVRARLLTGLAAACLVGMAGLWGAEALKTAALGATGPGMASALAAEVVMAIVAFGPPTVLMGALFSHLATDAVQSGVGFGRVLAANTLGAALAPGLFGVLLAPALGPKAALLLVVAGYLLLTLRLARPALPWAAAACAAGAVALWAPPLAFVEVPEGGRIVSYRDGALGAVSVVEDADGVARLRIDNRAQEGSSASLFADARQALLPLLLHPAPRRALFLGLGTGVTARSAAGDAQLQVDAVELLPEVIDASAHFAAAPGDGTPPRLSVVAADARRFVRATPQRYDLVVADNFHPARSGSAALYTVEHFQAVRERLADGGLFCQWLPLHQLERDTLRSIVAAFVAVHPQAWAVLATNSLETPVLGLVARADGRRFDPAQVRERLASAALPRAPAEFGLADEFALLGSFVAGPQALRRFAGDAVVNRDDHPVVAYLAPRATYAPERTPRDRLLALLAELRLTPDEVLADGTAGTTATRLAAYWQARDRYLLAGQAVRPSSDVRRMLAQVREPLLDVLRTSPDFRPAYDPLLQMAAVLARSDAAAARGLLTDLARAQPSRTEAPRALAQLEAAGR